MTMTRPRLSPMHNMPRWYLVLTVLWSAVMLLLPWAVVVVLGDRLPDPVATHWGSDGAADGFTPLATAWVWPVVAGGLLVVLLIGLGLATRQLRPLAAVCLGLATFIGGLGAGTIAAQADIAAENAPIGAPMAWSAVAGLSVGILAALLVRRISPVGTVERTRGPLPDTATRLHRPVATDLSWSGPTRVSRGVQIMGWATTVPLFLAAVILGLSQQWVVGAVLLGTGVAVGLLMWAFLGARVVVDETGVRVGWLGRVTLVRIPLKTIELAEPTTVSWGEFGGIGLRARIGGDGASGLITSSGEAVRINRAGQGPFYVTLDPADHVAALINTLVEYRG